MRYVVALLVAALLAVAAAGDARAQQVQRIAAIVNDDIVSVYDVQARLQMIIASAGLPATPEMKRRLAPQVLRSLIDERLRLQEAKRRNISVSRRDMNRAFGILEKQNGIPAGKFEQFLAAKGIPKDTVLDQIRAQIAWSKLISQRIAPRISIGDDEVQEMLERLKAQKGQLEYRIAEVVLTVDRPEREPEVRRVAQRLVEQLRKGADFAAVARQFSQSASASVGGDLGWIPESALSDKLKKIVPGMKVGAIAGPVTTLDGVEILLLIDKRKVLASNADDAVVKLRRILLPLPANATPEGVETQMHIARVLAETVRDCDDMARAAKEAASPVPPDIGTFRVGDLAGPVRAAVRDLAVGKASAPIRDDQGISVLMVCERTDPPTNLPTAREIEERLRNERIENAARRYMRDLRYAAVVDVRV